MEATHPPREFQGLRARWLDPTDAAYGEVHGTMEAKVQLWEGDTGTGRTVGTTATFAIPINPRGGVPS